MLKYLRIAVTALSLTACVLLIALWVASYSRLEAGTSLLVQTKSFSMNLRMAKCDSCGWIHSW